MDVNSLVSYLQNYVKENYPMFKSFQEYDKGLSRIKFILELDDHKIIFRIFEKENVGLYQREKKTLEALNKSNIKHLDFPIIVDVIKTKEFNILALRFIEGENIHSQIDKGIETWNIWNNCTINEADIESHKNISRNLFNKVIKKFKQENGSNRLLKINSDLLFSLMDKYLKHWPEEEISRLIHGDFHLANIIVGKEENLGMIDWEYSCIGDPLFDLAYLIIYYFGEQVIMADKNTQEGFIEYFNSISQRLKVDTRLFLEWASLASLIICIWYLEEFFSNNDEIFLTDSIKYLEIAGSIKIG